MLSCARPAAVPSRPPPALVPATGPEQVWSYEVAFGGGTLDIVGTFSAGSVTTFSLEDAATKFVSGVEVSGRQVAAKNGVWTLDSCERGCTVRYRFHLDEAAEALKEVDTAMAFQGGFEAPPSTWLLRPTDLTGPTTYRFHVAMGGGAHFATGVRPIPGAEGTYGAGANDLDTAPYTLLGEFRSRTLARADATIELAYLPGHLQLDDAAFDHWIDISARAIDAYYGHFPVKRLLLIVTPLDMHGSEPAEGRTLASGGASILLAVNGKMTVGDIPRDWVLTHEMTHLAMATLRREYHWLEEGSATYVEPIARAMVGTIPVEEVWKGLVEGLPQGEPAAGDEGLDRTHTWGRTYWGGALFCTVADVEIRRRTGGKKSLEDALRGILDAGGGGETRWPLEDVLREGDRAVGVPVLEELHAKWGGTPVNVDLATLWKELGVREQGGKVSLDDAAPEAALRRAVTPRPPSSSSQSER